MRPPTLGLAALLLLAALPARARGIDDLAELAGARGPKFEKSAPHDEAAVPRPSEIGQAGGTTDDCANFKTARPSAAKQFLPLDGGETLDVHAPKGEFKLIVDASGAGQISAIEAARRKIFPADFDEAQARMLRCTGLASQVILVTADGQLLGAHKVTKRYAQPYEIWSYDLNDAGRTAKVILTKGSLGETVGLCARYIDKAGIEFHRAFFDALDSHDEYNDDGKKTFKAVCGEPLSS